MSRHSRERRRPPYASSGRSTAARRRRSSLYLTAIRIVVLAGISGGTLVAEAGAQGTVLPARPDFRVLRFEENWSGLRGVATTGLLDRPKYMPLGDSTGIFLSVGGQFRSRTEHVANFGLLEGGGNTDTFGLMRALVHADLHIGPHLRAFVEGKHSVALGRSLPGGRRPLDHDEWELQNAFVDLSLELGGGSSIMGRLGRQELLMGSQRLLSPLDWANTRRTFEGVRVSAAAGPIATDGFVARPVSVRTNEPNRRDEGTLFWGGEVRPLRPAQWIAWSLYLLALSQESVTMGGFTGMHDRYTLGGRATGSLGNAANRYDLEAGWQTGSLGDAGISAWFVATDLTRTFASVPMTPTVTVGADYASGDGDPADDRIGTFHQLFPLGHAYAGYMDLLGRQNLGEGRAVITLSPVPNLQVRTAAHHFLRASTDDAAYNVGGGVFRAADGRARSIGTEIDVTAGYRANRHLRIEGGYGHFVPGSFAEESTAGAAPSHWLYVSTTLIF